MVAAVNLDARLPLPFQSFPRISGTAFPIEFDHEWVAIEMHRTASIASRRSVMHRTILLRSVELGHPRHDVITRMQEKWAKLHHVSSTSPCCHQQLCRDQSLALPLDLQLIIGGAEHLKHQRFTTVSGLKNGSYRLDTHRPVKRLPSTLSPSEGRYTSDLCYLRGRATPRQKRGSTSGHVVRNQRHLQS